MENTRFLQSKKQKQKKKRRMYIFMAASVEGGEASQYTIPVGTDGVTALGSVTTFSRLAQGDRISCLMEHTADEGDEILKIWIEE